MQPDFPTPNLQEHFSERCRYMHFSWFEDMIEKFRNDTADMSPYLMEYMDALRAFGRDVARKEFYFIDEHPVLTLSEIEEGLSQVKEYFDAHHYIYFRSAFLHEIAEIASDNDFLIVGGEFLYCGPPIEVDDDEPLVPEYDGTPVFFGEGF